MTAEEQKRYINYLAERVREADLCLRASDLVLQDFLDKEEIRRTLVKIGLCAFSC